MATVHKDLNRGMGTGDLIEKVVQEKWAKDEEDKEHQQNHGQLHPRRRRFRKKRLSHYPKLASVLGIEICTWKSTMLNMGKSLNIPELQLFEPVSIELPIKLALKLDVLLII